MHLRRDFQAEGFELDEAGGFVLVADPVMRNRVGCFHGISKLRLPAAGKRNRNAQNKIQSANSANGREYGAGTGNIF